MALLCAVGFEIYRKFDTSSGTSSLILERTTVHVSDDTGRIAMLEKRTIGTDDSKEVLTRYVYSNHLQSASLELDEYAAIVSYEEIELARFANTKKINQTFSWQYHPYGTTAFQAKSATINAVAKRYRYTGKERDEESGLYYHGARYYIPWLCRWTAIDPMESKYAGRTSYCYGANNPVIFNDPDGKQEQKTDGGINYTNFRLEGPAPSGYRLDDGTTFDESYEETDGVSITAQKQIKPSEISVDFASLKDISFWKAHRKLDFLSQSDSNSVWPNIDKAKFIEDLRQMVNNPRSINQQSTGLCGIASTVKAIADNDPSSLVEFAWNLYRLGETTTENGVFISANKSLLNNKIEGAESRLNSAEYVIMSSIRHSYNISMPYDPDNEGIQLSPITYPGDVSEIAEAISGLQDVTYDYSQDVDGIRKAILDGAFVIALFDMTQLTEGTPDSDILKSTFGEHYVQITNIGKDGNNDLWLKYWNYGKAKDIDISTSINNFNKAAKNFTILNYKK